MEQQARVQVNTNRYKGLLFLKSLGLPVPEFYKIETLSGLDEQIPTEEAPYGWTVRTCKRDGKNELGLFYRNRLSREELLAVLRERLPEYPDEFYIAYHSWNFYFSFNILKTAYRYEIEGKFGSQKKISSGQDSPSFRFSFNRLTRSFSGCDGISLSEREQTLVVYVIDYLECDSLKNDSYYEVAVTKLGEVFFYEYWGLANFVGIVQQPTQKK